MDVVELVKQGKCRFEWYPLELELDGYLLTITVMRDAMKFDGVPPLTWDFKPVPEDDIWYSEYAGQVFDGVRLPATAHQLQQIADLINAMLMTPKVIELLFIHAGLKFDARINTPKYPGAPSSQRNIVATSHIHLVHQEIEAALAKLGGDDGNSLIACVGKYWCLINGLLPVRSLHGDTVCCNCGWCAEKASGPGVAGLGVECWQRPGYRHNKQHWDPSQTIRLMYRSALLIHPDKTIEEVDLHYILQHELLCKLLSHEGPLKVLRQPNVPKLEPLVQSSSFIA